MSAIDRIIRRHHIRQGQPTIIWEPHHLLDLPEAESVGVLPYDKWFSLIHDTLTDPDLSEEEIDRILESFGFERFTLTSESLSQPLR